jgi:hypothetical protein
MYDSHSAHLLVDSAISHVKFNLLSFVGILMHTQVKILFLLLPLRWLSQYSVNRQQFRQDLKNFGGILIFEGA